jgi:mannose-6-phosphate isomerase-like protein (cupin superfamily)
MFPINLKEKFSLVDEYWSPKILGEFNGQLVKIAKLKGDFVWHAHDQEDELFYLVKGELEMRYRDKSVKLRTGDIHIVPKATEHFPVANNECWVMLIEPKGTAHTGDIITKRTKKEEEQEWI